jgi:hypothetical protein
MAEKISNPDSLEMDCDWCRFDYSELGEHFTGDEDDKEEHEQHLALKKLESYLRISWCCQ